MAPLVARALGVNPTREPVADLIKMRLGGRRVLLVLDTFEHVLDAAPFVADLLASCSGLTVLATSRAALRLRGAAIGDSHRAAVLAAAAAAIRKRTSTRPHPSDSGLAEPYLALARGDRNAWDSGWEAGADMPLDEVIKLAGGS